MDDMNPKKGGKVMTSKELEEINLECDLMDLVNKYAWPHSQKIVQEILQNYNVSPRHKRTPIHVVSKNASR